MRARVRLTDGALWVALAICLAITLVFSFGLHAPGAERTSVADEVGHAAIQFTTTLCLLLAAVWRPGRGDGPFPRMGSAFALGVVGAGMLIEVMQEVATRTRHAEVSDVLAEAAGVLGAWALHVWLRRRQVAIPFRSSSSL
ncbi:MAG TPA: hypothetical protein VFQ40_06645 [Actinomycetota bacterium]|nr:hypothetical protein [Actinomycetota bacterium]